jgi:polyhydroxybutyrate depolymerase
VVGGVAMAAAVLTGCTTRTTATVTPPTTAAPPPTVTIPNLPSGWVTTTVTMAMPGGQRQYLVLRPDKRSPTPLPVIVVLHGHDATPALEAQRTGFPAVVGQAILVFPAGEAKSWNAGTCCDPADTQNVDDVAFLTAVVSNVHKSQSDAGQDTFLAGYSNGAKMVYRMACEAPQVFDAVAAVGGVAAMTCARTNPVSLMQVAWTGDSELAIAAGSRSPSKNGFSPLSVNDQVSHQRAVDGCAPASVPQQQGALSEVTWDHCASSTAVALALYKGNSHSWPTGDAATPGATALIWHFFEDTGQRLDHASYHSPT